MKKTLAMILALCLVLLCTSAMAATPAEVVGTWYGVSVKADYSEFGAGVPTGDYRIELNRDGSALLVMNGEERQYKWSVTDDGVLLDTVDEYDDTYENYYDVELTLTDGELTCDTRDFSQEDSGYADFVYAREPVEAVMPEPVAAQAEDEFFGTWAADTLVLNGVVYDVTALNLTVKLEFAQITFTRPDEAPAVLLTDFVDGTLTCEATPMDYRAAKIACQPTETYGTLCAILYTEADEELYRVYLTACAEAPAEEPVAEEEAAEEEATEEEPAEENKTEG